MVGTRAKRLPFVMDTVLCGMIPGHVISMLCDPETESLSLHEILVREVCSIVIIYYTSIIFMFLYDVIDSLLLRLRGFIA